MTDLAVLYQNPNWAIELGKAAEHLVCADVILCGYRAYLSDQGLPYDVVVDDGERLIRVQVKATCSTRNLNKKGMHDRMGYVFHVRQHGKNNRKRLTNQHVDLVACVALDIQTIAYQLVEDVGMTCELMPPGYVFKGKYKRSRYEDITKFPFENVIKKLNGESHASR